MNPFTFYLHNNTHIHILSLLAFLLFLSSFPSNHFLLFSLLPISEKYTHNSNIFLIMHIVNVYLLVSVLQRYFLAFFVSLFTLTLLVKHDKFNCTKYSAIFILDSSSSEFKIRTHKIAQWPHCSVKTTLKNVQIP